LLAGELTSPRQAALPILAAAGGVVVPALLYAALNAGGAGARGWGIPMATDIAFAIGVMALLGDRVPLGLKVFLTALAIVDDIAAVLVIAVFSTAHLNWNALGVAAVCLLFALAANRLGVRHPLPYTLIGAVLWITVLLSGVHATIAGVLLAFMIPSRTAINQRDFLQHGRAVLDHFETAAKTEPVNILSDIEQQIAVEALEDACEKVQPPLHRLEHALHPWVTFLIMPLFALANAGVSLSGNLGKVFAEPVTLGVFAGARAGETDRRNACLVAGGSIRISVSSRERLMEPYPRRGLAGWDWVHDVALYDRFGFLRRHTHHGREVRHPDRLAVRRNRRFGDSHADQPHGVIVGIQLLN
jgi:NhaA family Na+:H+ antiporter